MYARRSLRLLRANWARCCANPAVFCQTGVKMAQFVYLDETGSVGKGARREKELLLVGVVIDEVVVRQLAGRMREVAEATLGALEPGFEFHAVELWHGNGPWNSLAPSELLEVFEEIIGLLDELDCYVVHAAINKQKLHDRYGGAYDDSAYLLALQFLLEKLDAWRRRDNLRVLVADEMKQYQLKAIEMVADLQRWAAGVVPGKQLNTVIDSIHFVQSHHSPGVQLADAVAFVMHRIWNRGYDHPDVDAALLRMAEVIANRTPTYRQPWPA